MPGMFIVTEWSNSDEARTEEAWRLSRLIGTLAEGINGTPTLGELLEVLSASVPGGGEYAGRLPMPLRLKAKIKGNRRYVGDRKSRVAELNDAAFVEASDFLSFLAGSRDWSVDAVVSGLLQALKDSGISFEDIPAADVASLDAEKPKKIVKFRQGDVVAIPGDRGDHHLAVVLVVRNRFGTALGILGGVFRVPRIASRERYRAGGHPVYVEDRLIVNGT
jgi:hypothetical protein